MCVPSSNSEQACAVHCDDFTASGPKPELDWFEATLKKSYELTVGSRLGHGRTDDKETIVLGRAIRWTDDCNEYEADPRQVEKLISEIQLEGEAVKGVVTPGGTQPPSPVRNSFTRIQTHSLQRTGR